MSVARPTRCLFCSFKQVTKRRAAQPHRQLTTSSRLLSDNNDSQARRSRQVSQPQSTPQSKQLQPQNVDEESPDLNVNSHPFNRISDADLEQNYTPSQRAAIQAAQSQTFSSESQPSRIHSQTTPKADSRSLRYYDDLSQIHPTLDHAVKSPWTNLDDSSRLKTDDEIDEDILKFVENMPSDMEQASKAWTDFDTNYRLTVGKEEAERNPRSAMVPELGYIPREGSGKEKAKDKAATSVRQGAQNRTGAANPDAEDLSPALLRLMQMTGFTQGQLRSLRVKSIVSHRVVNQTRLGKIQKQYWLSIAGNGNGLLGIGEGKSEEAAEGMLQSQYRAIRNMQPVLRYEGRTIFGDVEGKSGATELELFARPPGFGLRCQHHIWEMCRAAGISDLAARVNRARNPMNTVKAAFQAMLSQKDPEEIAKGRGKKMVDVRRVYYAGNV